MSQKHPLRTRDRAAKLRRVKSAAAKKEKKVRRDEITKKAAPKPAKKPAAKKAEKETQDAK